MMGWCSSGAQSGDGVWPYHHLRRPPTGPPSNQSDAIASAKPAGVYRQSSTETVFAYVAPMIRQ